MINFKSNIVLILLAFAVSGCATCKPIPDQINNAILNNEKALVVVSARTNYPEGTKDMHASTCTVWENINKENDFIPQSSSSVFCQGLQKSVLCAYAVNPGKYKLTTIVSRRLHSTTLNAAWIIQSLYVDNLMDFEVSSGEVIYLGDIIFNNNGNEITYEVLDKFDSAYEESKAMFPKLLPKMKKRIILNPSSHRKSSKIIGIEENVNWWS